MKILTFPINPGCSRHVLIFKKFVIKLPRVSAWFDRKLSIDRFKLNLGINRYERKMALRYKGQPGIPVVYFADRFGFMLVMKRYYHFKSVEQYIDCFAELVKTSTIPYEFWDNDACIANFGLDEDNNIVKIDLG